MRYLSSLLFIVACGSEPDHRPVTDLSTSAQVDLCERFVDNICADPQFASFCDPCQSTGCAAAVDNGHVAAECGALGAMGGRITAQMVEDCGTGEVTVCAQGGGCMFDALEAACP